MHSVRRFVLPWLGALVVVAGSTPPAVAQTVSGATDRVAEPPARRIDVTPFVAMGDDYAPGAGAAFNIPWTRHLSVEAEASIGTDAARSSVSLLYSIPKLGRFAPYIAGGGGVQRDEVDMGALGITLEPRKKTEFAVNIGAGVSVPLGDRWAWRTDFRWYNPTAEWPESWRVYYGLSAAVRH